MKRQEAPGRLEMVRSFLNTIDRERGVDAFDTTRGLAEWLAGWLPGIGPAAPSERDLRAALDLRTALRAVVANAGAPTPAVVAALNRSVERLPVRLCFTEAMTARLASRRDGIDAVLAELAGIVAAATITGTWGRLKMCPAEDCRWVFYDNSRNGLGVWCQMAECGNRHKVRTHRSRQRAPRAATVSHTVVGSEQRPA